MLHLSHLSSVYLCKHNKSAEPIIAQPDGTSCDADVIRRSVEQDGKRLTYTYRFKLLSADFILLNHMLNIPNKTDACDFHGPEKTQRGGRILYFPAF